MRLLLTCTYPTIRLGEHINKLVFIGNCVKVKATLPDMMSNKVTIDLNVFDELMEDIVAAMWIAFQLL